MTCLTGLELSRRFYTEEVAPLLADAWPNLAHSAALIGPGSEVLGFDDGVSQDHHWGPRVMIFLSPADLDSHGTAIHDLLAESLPYEFLGFSTSFAPPDPSDNGTRLLTPVVAGPVSHRVELFALDRFLTHYIGIGDLGAIDQHDWLTLPEQKLRSLISGDVFHDGLPAPTDPCAEATSRPVASRKTLSL